MEEISLQGIGVSGGIRIGKAYVYESRPAADTGREIEASAVEEELARFQDAVRGAAREVDALLERASGTLGEDKLGVLKGQKSFLSDPAYAPEIEKQIRKSLCSPEKAVRQVTENFARIFEKMNNPYMRERAADIRDTGDRLLGVLAGGRQGCLGGLCGQVILLAEDLAPADTVQLDREHILGFATEKGGKTAHTSLFAKSLGLPAAVGVAGLLAAAHTGDTVILDGEAGVCVVRPAEPTVERYEALLRGQQARQALFDAACLRDGRTKDGRRVLVAANIGSAQDAACALTQGAEGAGLFRTEQLYLSRADAPGAGEQFEEYKKIAGAFGEREAIVRTLDIGGDKAVPYLGIPKEANPFLGYRAIRLCLGRKELFRTQLEAILRASAYGNLAIMFPMISGYDELLEAKGVLEEVKAGLRAKNVPFNEKIKTGIMIEVPAAALMADELAAEADFFSIGTNDLTQYTVAVDRGNETLAALYDTCNPAVIRLVARVAQAARRHGIRVGMCGGMAGDPQAVPLLVGLGLDELSMPAGAVPEVKYLLGRLDSAACEALARSVLEEKSVQKIHGLLENFAAGLSED